MDLITIVTVIGIRRCNIKDDVSEILTPTAVAVECIIEGDAFVTPDTCFCLLLFRPRF